MSKIYLFWEFLILFFTGGGTTSNNNYLKVATVLVSGRGFLWKPKKALNISLTLQTMKIENFVFYKIKLLIDSLVGWSTINSI